MLRKIAPIALLSIGSLLMLFGFLLYASNAIPYQDATPDMLTYQAAEARKWGVLFLLGLAVTASGIVWLWRRWRERHG
jgi:hypothetical protein